MKIYDITVDHGLMGGMTEFCISGNLESQEEAEVLAGMTSDHWQNLFKPNSLPEIKGVWFNREKGITVVKWKDSTISKVKLQKGDSWNPEHGLAMCIAKKAFGNKGNYNDVFKKWLPEKEKIELCEQDAGGMTQPIDGE